MTESPRSGLWLAFSAYALWGFMPLYVVATAPTTPVELIAWRIILSVVFCLLGVLVMRAWRPFRELISKKRVVLGLGIAGVLVSANWLFYVQAVATGHTLDAALGYFLNPIVSVALGLVFLREKLRPLQWVAVGLSLLAVLVISLGYGRIPWLGLGVAMTFGLYGLVKKRVGVQADALSGLAVETTLIMPIGAICLLWTVLFGGGITFGSVSAVNTGVLLFAGVVTSVPLLLFAAAARRLRLIELGLMQYIAPILQFVLAVAVFSEPMPLERWIGFAIVWVALILFTIDLVRTARLGAKIPSVADELGPPTRG
ncbi:MULTISPECIES: EamA family transporter RarD [unclassified Pseudoclavibacter]|uniref:EamA family transporter RarD n=1 Tax=unclassified Pseudoclavibacter TaxID=2615177 RepID=UPI0021588C6B|nr:MULTISPECIES: EamA family transporter RarD [unclassified Pseudoclavibacter]